MYFPIGDASPSMSFLNYACLGLFLLLICLWKNL